MDRLEWVEGDGPLQHPVPVFGRPVLQRGERHVADDPMTGTSIIATRQPKLVNFAGAELFNAFRALDLRYTLWDEADVAVQRLTYEEMEAWQEAPEDRKPGVRLSLYPAPEDRPRILAFLGHYGPDFLPYPRPERVAKDQLDYFSEFNGQYQTFAHAVRYLVEQPVPPPTFSEGRGGSTTSDPVDIALNTLHHGLDQIKPRLRRLADGAVMTTFEPTHRLYLCYATLWEALNSHQSPFKFCALPSCQRPFIPQRKDQTCCTPAHATNLRQSRHRCGH